MAQTPEQLKTHHVDGAVNLNVTVLDKPGAGGAHHEYEITHPDWSDRGYVGFQNGPIAENGVNGVTNEALLAIVEHRLNCFQAGPFACGQNSVALGHVRLALKNLKQRTISRMARGVEGKSKP